MEKYYKICLNCGEQFDATSSPARITCSTACTAALVRKNRTSKAGDELPREWRRCVRCDTVFRTRGRDTVDPRFCSLKCQRVETRCWYCGRIFKAEASEVFCSAECQDYWRFDKEYDEAQERLHKCACPACDEQISGNRKFCSDYCRLSTQQLQRILSRNGSDRT